MAAARAPHPLPPLPPVLRSSSAPARPRRTCQENARVLRLTLSLGGSAHALRASLPHLSLSSNRPSPNEREHEHALSGHWCTERTSRRPPSCAAPSQFSEGVHRLPLVRAAEWLPRVRARRAGKRGAAVRGPRGMVSGARHDKGQECGAGLSHPLALPGHVVGHGGSWRRAVGVCREPLSHERAFRA